jgi:HAD superfamily hydrolase (TIGR01509 family)
MTPLAVIFDLDGTLADTFPVIVSSWNAAVSPVTGIRYSQADVMARFGPTEVEMIRRELPPEHRERAIATFRRRYEEDHQNLVTVFDGVPELLKELAAAKIAAGVMTGKGRDTANITLAKLGWTNLFSNVVTGDEVTRAKPDPQGVLMVAEHLQVAPNRCVYVGDAPYDIRAGQAAGMTTAWAGWHPIYAKEIELLKPDFRARTPIDLLRLLQSDCC